MWRVGISIVPSSIEDRFHATFFVGKMTHEHEDSDDVIHQEETKELHHVRLEKVFQEASSILKKKNYDAEIWVYFFNTYNQQLGAWRLRRSEVVKFGASDKLFYPVGKKIFELHPLWKVPLIDAK